MPDHDPDRDADAETHNLPSKGDHRIVYHVQRTIRELEQAIYFTGLDEHEAAVSYLHKAQHNLDRTFDHAHDRDLDAREYPKMW